MSDRIGTVLNERYRLEAEIGRGGMGIVYRAHDSLLQRDVAIKVLSEATLDSESRARLLREAQAVAQLHHANVVSVHDAGEAEMPGLAGRVPFIVMELVEGESLYDRPPASLEETVAVGCQVCAALEHAHAHNIVHRDLKPENILLSVDGTARLVDFGLARTVASRLTTEGTILGTIYYLAPEQAQGGEIDGRADLYALGVMLYEWATGRLPFTDAPPAIILSHHLHTPAVPPREHDDEIPPPLDALILRLLSKQPEDRPASAAEVRGALEALGRAPAPAEAAGVGVRLPGFLRDEVEEQVDQRPAFVARERELGWLDGFLEQTLGGQARVVFVTGGPGRGKTALLDEFARGAMDEHPDLLVAGGTCNAYSGVGDPYLPFREVLAMLTGEVEARWAAGAIGHDQARRLWNALPAAVGALLDHGPHVVPALLPGEALLARAEAACLGAAWLGRLRERVERGRAGASGLEQSHLFQQVSNVLRALSEDHPLLLILDDLQWVDRTSAGLLFHLGRRLEGSRILIVGAYRPEELTPRADDERHPLDKLLAEFKRLYGDVWLDLAEIDEPQGRCFVDALLDTEPNQLDEGFRQALADRAEGHALFTVELLRAMQERGDLVRDETGRWVEGPALDWERLPARVEGVIGERIERLEEDLRDVLTVACVEGEDFTAEVVAQVRAVEARELVRRLSGELQREHRLVRARGLLRLGARRLALYRFQHHLFQKYLYNSLDEAERAYLHEDVGAVLEALYGEQTDEVAVQLARHFLEARVTGKAAHYFGRAGELAAERYANEEAVEHFSRTLELVPETDGAGRYRLLLARENVYDLLGQRDAQRRDLAELETLAQGLAIEQQAEVAVQRATYTSKVADYSEAMVSARVAVEQARSAGHAGLEAQGKFLLAAALLGQSDFAASREHVEAALVLAQAAGQPNVEAHALFTLGSVSQRGYDWVGARHYYEQALHLLQQIDHQRGVVWVLHNLGVVCQELGDYAEALAYLEPNLRHRREMGDRYGEAYTLCCCGYVRRLLGEYTRAREYYEQSLCVAREIEEGTIECFALCELGELRRRVGDNTAAQEHAEQAWRLAHRMGDLRQEVSALHALGALLQDRGDPGAARECYEQALRLPTEIGSPAHAADAMVSRAGLASVALALGGAKKAQAHVAEILAYLDAGGVLSTDNKPFWVYLTCYRVLQADGDPRAAEILATAYRLLQEQAARTPDEATRRSFLENVAENREIVELARGTAPA